MDKDEIDYGGGTIIWYEKPSTGREWDTASTWKVWVTYVGIQLIDYDTYLIRMERRMEYFHNTSVMFMPKAATSPPWTTSILYLLT